MITKLIWTAVILGIGYGAYLATQSIVTWLGASGLALVMLLLGLYVVIAAIVLWSVWRPGRIDDPTARPQLRPEERPGATPPGAPPGARPPSGPPPGAR